MSLLIKSVAKFEEAEACLLGYYNHFKSKNKDITRACALLGNVYYELGSLEQTTHQNMHICTFMYLHVPIYTNICMEMYDNICFQMSLF
jgi:hypothetical protein